MESAHAYDDEQVKSLIIKLKHEQNMNQILQRKVKDLEDDTNKKEKEKDKNIDKLKVKLREIASILDGECEDKGKVQKNNKNTRWNRDQICP